MMFPWHSVAKCKDGIILLVTPMLLSPLLIWNYPSTVWILYLDLFFCLILFLVGIPMCLCDPIDDGVLDLTTHTIGGDSLVTGSIVSLVGFGNNR